MLNRTIRTAFLAAITLGVPAVASATPNHPAATETVKQLPTAASANDASQYAEREASVKEPAEFEGGMIESTGGGTVIVMSGAALVAFLLLALLII